MEMDLNPQAQEDFPESTTKISDDLSPDERRELEEILEKEYELSLDMVDHRASIYLINRMIMKAIRCEEVTVYEMELLKMAQTAHMPVHGLETLEQQMGIAADIYTSKELLKQLKLKDLYEEMFENLQEAYRVEDLNALEKMISNRELMSAGMETIMVSGRNEDWANQLENILQGPSAFIAVGAGHLPGETGLIQLLRKRGYRVNPVFR